MIGKFKVESLKLKVGIIVLLFTFNFVLLTSDALASVAISTTIKTNPQINTASSSASTGLVGWWTFDGKDTINNIADVSGNYATGSLILGSTGNTATTTVPGRLGQAMLFDGLTDRAVVPRTKLINMPVVSISFWYRWTNVNNGLIFSNRVTSSGWSVNQNNSKIQFNVDFDTTDINVVSTANTCPSNIWCHVLVTWDGSSAATNVHMYANGREAGYFTQTDGSVSRLDDSVTTAAIGGTNVSGNSCDCEIDDLRIYNKVLTLDDAKRLYGLGASTHIATTIKTNPSINTASSSASTGLVGWWTFDGPNMINNVADVSGNYATGSLILGSTGNTATTTTMGRMGQAIVFDGVNDYVKSSSVPTTATNNFTLSAWANPYQISQAGQILQNGDGSGGYGIAIGHASGNDTAGSNFLALYSGSAWLNSGYVFPQANTWYHLVLVRDSGTTKFYVNGTQTSNTYVSAPNTPVGTLDIGRRGSGLDYFKGAVDDARVYNRVLSPTEIKRLYNLGATTHIATTIRSNQGLSGPGSGLVGHWTFDGAQMNNNVADISGSYATGSLILGSTGNTATTTTMGRLGQALSFDGLDDYTRVPNISPIDITSNAVSVSAWIYTPNTLKLFQRLVMKQTSAGENQGYALQFFNTSGNIYFSVSQSGGTMKSKQGSVVLANNKWYHVVGVYDGAGVSVYVNGVLDGSPTAATLNLASNSGQPLVLGQSSDLQGASTAFNGSMDDVRIYNRALSAGDVKRLYDLGR